MSAIDTCIGYIASRVLLKDNHTLGSGLKKNVEEKQAIRFKKAVKIKKIGWLSG